MRASIRALKQAHKMRLIEIAAEAPSTVPNFTDYNTTQRREAIKILVGGDEKIAEIEVDLSECQSVLDEANANLDHHKLGIGALTARMTELGGLLHFYAEAKHAQTAQRSNPQVDTPESESQA